MEASVCKRKKEREMKPLHSAHSNLPVKLSLYLIKFICHSSGHYFSPIHRKKVWAKSTGVSIATFPHFEWIVRVLHVM